MTCLGGAGTAAVPAARRFFVLRLRSGVDAEDRGGHGPGLPLFSQIPCCMRSSVRREVGVASRSHGPREVAKCPLDREWGIAMELTDLWLDSPDQIRGKHLQQIIAFAGDGKLRDTGLAAEEFRRFLSVVPSDLLTDYAEQCLNVGFPNSGLALQDVVNEVGSRLGFSVEHGRYRGSSAKIGFDGLWALADGRSIVIEVKTTDAYRIDLDTVVGYRRRLIDESKISADASSILIVVGREDTGDVEAQVRGSRHAWDIRLISVDSLLRLMLLKEAVEDPVTLNRIHDILFPREFTKLDEIVEVVFSAAEEAKQEDEPRESDVEEPEQANATQKKFTPVAFHQQCVERLQKVLGTTLVRQSRAQFLSPDKRISVVCAVSRAYEKPDGEGYWFAFHPHQKDFLESTEQGYAAFGCGSANTLVLVPIRQFVPWLDGMNRTVRNDREYWHVQMHRQGIDVRLTRRKNTPEVDLSAYVVLRDPA